MEEIDKIVKKLRDKYIATVRDYLDPGYQILSYKKNPLSQ